jgi:hypothetical protein
MALLDANGELTLSAVVEAMSAKRDDYDRRAIAYAEQNTAIAGEVEVDSNALTSRGDDENGCYVMAWIWVGAEDIGDDAAEAGEACG